MKLGVVGLLPDWRQIDAVAAARVRAAGFRGASIVIERPLEVEPGEVRQLKQALGAGGLEAAQANGRYESLVNQDLPRRAEGVAGLQAMIRIGRELNAETVYVRPGSLNPAGPWYPHPENHSAATFDRLVHSLRQAAGTAEQEGVTLALEGHVLSPVDSPARVRAVLDAVGSRALRFNLDVVNFVGSVAHAHDAGPLMDDLFAAADTKIAAVHMKDCALKNELVLHIREAPLGEGTLDLAGLLRRLDVHCPNVYCLIEHLPDEQIPRARRALVAAARAADLVLEE